MSLASNNTLAFALRIEKYYSMGCISPELLGTFFPLGLAAVFRAACLQGPAELPFFSRRPETALFSSRS